MKKKLLSGILTIAFATILLFSGSVGMRAALGDTIGNHFPDPNMAQAVADKVSGGNLNAIVDNSLISSTNTLDLANKGIKDITGIEIFTELQFLYLQDNEIEFLPDDFGNLNKAFQIWLQRNELTSLPDSVGNLSSILDFDLKFNKLTELPDSIVNLQGNMTPVVYLEVNNNCLTSLTQAQYDYLTSLQYGYIYDQQYMENLITEGIEGTDYSIAAAPAYTQFPNYRTTFTFTLTQPDGTILPVTPNFIAGEMILDNSVINQVGSYTLVADGAGGSLAPIAYTYNFTVNAAPLPPPPPPTPQPTPGPITPATPTATGSGKGNAVLKMPKTGNVVGLISSMLMIAGGTGIIVNGKKRK